MYERDLYSDDIDLITIFKPFSANKYYQELAFTINELYKKSIILNSNRGILYCGQFSLQDVISNEIVFGEEYYIHKGCKSYKLKINNEEIEPIFLGVYSIAKNEVSQIEFEEYNYNSQDQSIDTSYVKRNIAFN